MTQATELTINMKERLAVLLDDGDCPRCDGEPVLSYPMPSAPVEQVEPVVLGPECS